MNYTTSGCASAAAGSACLLAQTGGTFNAIGIAVAAFLILVGVTMLTVKFRRNRRDRIISGAT